MLVDNRKDPQIDRQRKPSGERVLISGASGLLGANLALVAAQKYAVTGLVNRRPMRSDDITFLPLDLLNRNVLSDTLDKVNPDWIIHCAALADVDACERYPDLAYHLNTEIPGEFSALAERKNCRFIHISTDAVFDGQRGGYIEEDSPNPLGVYARTKLDGEKAVLQANPEAIVARVNLFGWSMSGERSLAEFFINNLQAGRQIKGFTDVFFCPLLVNDLAQVLLEMLALDLHGIYHVFSSECVSKFEFGMRIARRFGLDENLIFPSSVDQAGLAAARSQNLHMRSDKIQAILGYTLPGIQDGIDKFYELYHSDYIHKLREMLLESNPDN